MNTPTKKAPGRPKKVQPVAETPVSPPTAPKKKKPVIRRKEQVNQHKEFEIVKGGGIVFLLPLCIFIVLSSWGYVGESWSMRETSPEPGGIPAVFLLKTLIPVAAINLALQGIAEIMRSALVLAEGRTE